MGKLNEDGSYTNDNGETFSAQDVDYALSQERNAAQPKGRWDAGSQTWTPAVDPTHGKASRKWNPGGVAQWDQAAQQQRNANIGQLLANEQMAQGQMWNEFSSVMDAVKQKKAQNALAKQNASASLMRVAMDNGGAIPDEAIALYNRMFNYDGQTAGLVGGSGFMKDGSFNMRMITGSDANGNPVVQDVKADLPMQFVMMNRNRPVFGQSAVEALAGKLKEVGYSPREIENLAVMGGGGSLMDSYRARGGFGDGSAGGRNIGSVSMSGGTARRLFGVGGDNRSRISFFGTGGAGTGYTMRVADGHTGEDTGFVDDQIRQGRTAELAKGRWKVVSVGPSDDGKTQVRVYENEQTGERRTVRDGQGLPQTQEAVELAEATRRGKGGRTFDEEKELARIRSENRIKESEAAQAGREKIEGLKTERDRERQRSLYKKSLGTIKIKTVTGERTLTPEEISDAMKNWDEDNPAPQGGQATSSRVDNSGSEKWGSLTPAQIEKVKAKGGTYDEKTGEIVLPNGKRMKV